VIAALLVALASLVGEPAEIDAIAARLAGQRVEVAADHRSIAILDIAGEGPPRVGVVEREGAALVLVTAEGRLRMVGPLARPRIAGPGYTVWVIGPVVDGAIQAHRLGILRRPPEA
jgi:hypothetical protein